MKTNLKIEEWAALRRICKPVIWVTGALLLCICNLGARAQKSDFSGYWVLNKGKSALSDFPVQILDDDFKVRQSGNSIVLTRNSTSPPVAVERLRLTGEPAISINKDHRKKIVNAQHGKTAAMLHVEYWISEPDEPEKQHYKFVQIWTLAADKKSLTMEVTVESVNGTSKGLAVFDRK